MKLMRAVDLSPEKTKVPDTQKLLHIKGEVLLTGLDDLS